MVPTGKSGSFLLFADSYFSILLFIYFVGWSDLSSPHCSPGAPSSVSPPGSGLIPTPLSLAPLAEMSFYLMK